MKKIYSILLMAVALLISTNLKADVTVTSYAELRDALAGTETVINLGNDITCASETELFYLNREVGTVVTLNLAGHNIKNDYLQRALFNIYRGTLKVTGSGQVSTACTGNYGSSQILFVVMGTSVPTIANYAGLEIGENVNVLNTNSYAADSGEKAGIGIVIRESNGYSKVYAKTNVPVFDMQNLGGFHNTKITYTKSDETTATADLTYGVKVVVKGTVSAPKYGIKINGTSQSAAALIKNKNATGSYTAADGNSYSLTADNADANLPILEIASTAKIYSAETAQNAVAVYCAGPGNVSIMGECAGSTGLYVKSGNINVVDATIKSTATEYNAISGDRKSGVDAGGSAIVIESSASYAGTTSVNISGDSKIEAQSGYAIDEAITQTSGETKVSTITIEGGSFAGGDQVDGGVIKFEQATAGTSGNADVVVSGGNIEGTVAIGEINDALDQVIGAPIGETAVITPVVIETEDGTKTTYVINTVAGEIEEIDDTEESYDLTAQGGKNIDLNGLTAEQIANSEWTITENLDLGTVMLRNANPITITIDGATLTVEQLTMSANAQIIVKDDAKLIIKGTNGFNTFSTSNIIVEASAASQGQVLFNPAVESGRHPKATVNYVASSYKVGPGEFVFQYMGHPMYNGSVTEVSMAPAGTVGFFNVWNGTTYDEIGYINSASTPQASDNLALFNRDFGFYALQTNNAQGDKPTVTFKGQVNGNNDAALRILNKWTTASNGYLGYIDNEAILSAVSAWGATPYVYQYYIDENGDLKWQAKGSTLRPLSDIAPMEPMMFYRNGAQDVTLDYSALVWNPATGEAVPAPSRATNDMTMATINVKGEGCEDEVIVAQTNEEGAPKYLSGKLNLYVSAEEKMDIYTAEDLNNTLIGYQVAKAGVYTMTFNNVQGNALTLVDLANGAQVNIEEGATYTFAASANETNDARFQVLEARKMPTDVETIEAAKAQKGIYSLVGAYLGEDFDVLPAGIYVVNGVKVVK